MNIQTCEFISATDLVPEDWVGWFWELISENAPFSWGDNNRSLITANYFAKHCEKCLDKSKESKQFIDKLYKLKDLYIDLES